MKRTRIKICGIRTTKDALFAAGLGADAIGFVFFEKSPRNVSLEQASEICSQVPAFVNRVGLFVNAEKAFVEDVLSQVNIDTLQFHGDESLAFCQQFQKPFIKAVSIADDENEDDLLKRMEEFSEANSILLDRFDKVLVGGTGKSFNWNIIPEQFKGKIILAGGLDIKNISMAIENVHPYGVDVSSGVESSKGLKDQALMQAFVEAVYEADYKQLSN